MDFFEISGNKQVGKITKSMSRDTLPVHSAPHIVYKDIRVGEMIKVVRMEGGMFNCYKGYIGEVKDYKRGQDSALVVLNAINSPKLLRMPLDHFIKLQSNQ